MPRPPARRWRPLLVGAGLAAVAGAAPPGATAPGGGPLASHGCGAGCALERPTAAELAAILADADRVAAAHAADSSALGADCRRLAAAVRAGAGEVRMLPYAWREPDADGQLARVTGDAHRVEPAPGAGRVHIARGYDPLNPERGLAAIARTARHEFAHLGGARQGEGWEWDAAESLADACGAP